MTTDKTLALARKHLGKGNMESSARVCVLPMPYIYRREGC